MAKTYTVILNKVKGLFQSSVGGMPNKKLFEDMVESYSQEIVNGDKTGAPGDAEVLVRFVAPVEMIMKATAPGSQAVAGTASTGTVTCSLKKNGAAAFATIEFDASATGVFTQAAEEAFSAGDVLTVEAPASADASLADLAVSLILHK